MRLINPNILTSANGLSFGAAGFILFVGLLLWLCGWRWHKFWVVFGITTVAGVLGLSAGQAAGSQVLVLGILLAFAGGVMALEVAKLIAFAGGGVIAWLSVQTVLPQAHEMWAVFLAGGLFGVLLYKLWTMIITSFVGSLLAVHALLVMVAESNVGISKWTGDNAIALNGVVAIGTVIGVVTQAILSREPAKFEEIEEEEEVFAPMPTAKKKSWWRKAA